MLVDAMQTARISWRLLSVAVLGWSVSACGGKKEAPKNEPPPGPVHLSKPSGSVSASGPSVAASMRAALPKELRVVAAEEWRRGREGCVTGNLAPGAEIERACLNERTLTVSGGDLNAPMTVGLTHRGTLVAGDLLDRGNRKRAALDELLVSAESGAFELIAYDWRSKHHVQVFAAEVAANDGCAQATFAGIWAAILLPTHQGGALVAIGEQSFLARTQGDQLCVQVRASGRAPEFGAASSGDPLFELDIDADGQTDTARINGNRLRWRLTKDDRRGQFRWRGRERGGEQQQVAVAVLDDWPRAKGRALVVRRSEDLATARTTRDAFFSVGEDDKLHHLMAVQTRYTGGDGAIEATRRTLTAQELAGNALLLKETLAVGAGKARRSTQWFFIGDRRLDVDRNYQRHADDRAALLARLGELPTLGRQATKTNQQYIGADIDRSGKPLAGAALSVLAGTPGELRKALGVTQAMGKGQILAGADRQP